MSDLVLNAFPVDIAPTRLTLPVHYYSNWAKSKDGFAKELRSSLVHRFWEVYSDQSGARQGRVVAVVFSAPRESNDQLETREFDFGEHPTLASVGSGNSEPR